MPLLIRRRVLDAVRAAQAAGHGPVTAAEVLVKLDPPLARSPRALTALLHRVAATGADETGRRLAGDVDRLSVWRWVVEGGDPRDTEIATRAAALAQPGEDLHAVLLRALDSLASTEAPPARRALPVDFNRFTSNGEDCEVRSTPSMPPEPSPPPAPPLTHKLPLAHPHAREGRFWSDGSDISIRGPDGTWSKLSGEPSAPRPDERRDLAAIEIPEIATPPEPRPTEPQETPAPVDPAGDQQSSAPPDVVTKPDAASAPTGPLRAALARVRAMRGTES